MTSTTSTQPVSFSFSSMPSSFTSSVTKSLSSTDLPSSLTSSTSSSSPSPPPSSSTSAISSTSVTSTSSSSSSSTSTQTSSSQTTSTSTSTSASNPGTSSATSDSLSSSLSQQQTLNPSGTSSTTIVPTITTESRSSISYSASAVITSTSLSTDTNGKLVTITQLYPNQTLSPNNPSPNNTAFFRNTAAVAGVFILVGLAATSIILWIFFAIRSRRRTQRLDRDTAVSATLAAAGFHRTPLDDDDDDDNPAETSRRSRYGSPDAFLHQRRSSSGLAMSSIPSAGRASAAFLDTLPLHDDNDPHDFNPYSDYIVPAGSKDGYVSSPPSSSFPVGLYRNRSYSNTMGENVTGHTPQHSGGSHEPLLSSYNRNSLPPSPTGVAPPPQRLSDAQKNPPALSDKPQQSSAALEASATSSVYSSESTGDHRLDPNLRQRLQDDSDSFRDLRDEEDYSRPVLGVRNMPDASSQASVQ